MLILSLWTYVYSVIFAKQLFQLAVSTSPLKYPQTKPPIKRNRGAYNSSAKFWSLNYFKIV